MVKWQATGYRFDFELRWQKKFLELTLGIKSVDGRALASTCECSIPSTEGITSACVVFVAVSLGAAYLLW